MNTAPAQTVLLTGASGGLGKYMAHAFANPGTRLALVAHPGAELEALRREITQSGAEAFALVADLRVHEERHRVVREVVRQFGPIDLLINNAGVEFTEPFHEQSETQIRDTLAVNLEAPMILTRLILPSMLERRRGHIVNISSLAGKAGPPYEEAYVASKAGLITFTASLRASYRPLGVSASVILPGFVEAGIYARLKAQSGASAPLVMGTSRPEKVAAAVLRAIRDDRFETIVNPLPVRPLLTLWTACPSLGEWLFDKLGTNDFFRGVVRASRRKEPKQEPEPVPLPK